MKAALLGRKSEWGEEEIKSHLNKIGSREICDLSTFERAQQELNRRV